MARRAGHRNGHIPEVDYSVGMTDLGPLARFLGWLSAKSKS